ncbi:MAG: hypothetical protein FJZ10_06745 [Candidatus Omnitrophica bacterium]|nr:hypothetical protein [Candidatus Omnitrophota bacterium]
MNLFNDIKSKNKQASNAGFTLVELIITNLVLIYIIGAFTFVTFTAMRNWNYQRQDMDLRESAANALDLINQDLRKASSITTATANSITFAISPYETITYARVLGGSGLWQLQRTYAATTSPVTSITSAIAYNVNSFTLAYYTGTGATMTVPVPGAQLANIRLVRITLVNQSTQLLFTDSVTVRAQVRPRNM